MQSKSKKVKAVKWLVVGLVLGLFFYFFRIESAGFILGSIGALMEKDFIHY